MWRLLRQRLEPARDRGESLIELLVAVVILGTAVVAVVGGLGTALMMSTLQRKQAEAALRDSLWLYGQDRPFPGSFGGIALVSWPLVSGDYFEAMGLEFLAGGPPHPLPVTVAIAASRGNRRLAPGPSPPLAWRY